MLDNFSNLHFLRTFDLFTSDLQQQGLSPLLVNLFEVRNPESTVQVQRQLPVSGVIVASWRELDRTQFTTV